MNIDPAHLDKPDRDRFVLSKGHTAPGYYRALAHRGYFPVDELSTLRHAGSRLQKHPCMVTRRALTEFRIPGTGHLGKAVTMAMSAKLSGDSYRV